MDSKINLPQIKFYNQAIETRKDPQEGRTASKNEVLFPFRRRKVYLEILLEEYAVTNTRPRFVRVSDDNVKMPKQL